jgi:hypothetical protein
MARASAQTIHDQIRAEDPSGVVDETPSKKLVRENAKNNTKVLTDELGREIVYRSLGPLEQMRLYRILGDLSSNDAYSRYAMIAMSVQTIDGDRGVPATSILTVEARVAWIGEEGFSAIWAELIRASREFVDDRDPQEIAEEHKSALKKSSSEPA